MFLSICVFDIELLILDIKKFKDSIFVCNKWCNVRKYK